MSKYIRFAAGIVGAILILTAVVVMVTDRSEPELPEGNPLLVSTDNAGQPIQTDTAPESALPSEGAPSASPDLSWEWPVDSNGNIIIDPTSASDLPLDAGGDAQADTP